MSHRNWKTEKLIYQAQLAAVYIITLLGFVAITCRVVNQWPR